MKPAVPPQLRRTRRYAMTIHHPMKNLTIVDLDQPLEGFRNFLSSWVYRSDGMTVVVDPGPRSTIPVVVEALTHMGVKKIEYILLTHIHIDHAGGAGLLVAHYPDAKVICHPKGIRHMVDPTKLWEGSRTFLGKVAEVYGEIAAIPEKNISYENRIHIGNEPINVFETPGHAINHLCYQIGDILFLGEVTGINYPLDEGLYLRIATPPPFIYEIYRSSLEKVAALNVSHVCFGHYGYREDVKNVFDTGLNQLNNWIDTVAKHFGTGSDLNEEKIYGDLLKNDRGLSLYGKLPGDVQSREKIFSLNSIRGMWDYLKERDKKPD
jgi:glyoxylase-like metal-dependent hydrolase (beta-lactamase superfamily II)